MSTIPRIAVGSLQPSADSATITWALMTLLRHAGWQVQHFHARACFPQLDGATPSTGASSRHLDSWLMTPEVCREVFWRAARDRDLAVVEGALFDRETSPLGSRLEVLCDWLNLPRVLVLDVSRLGECQLPPPGPAEALLLDHVRSLEDFLRWQTILEPLWGIPVLGGLDEAASLREAIRELPVGGSPESEICRHLATRMHRFIQYDRLQRVASRGDLPAATPRLFHDREPSPRVRVAVAFDEVFNCYFPDTLDLLELRGAELVEFSPLADERLPAGTDVVYFGCGHPERYGPELAQNHCMTLALQNHVVSGGRVYGEGGGLAYLCQRLETADGEPLSMTGVIPAVAKMTAAAEVEPMAGRLVEDSWLGRAGSELRGYRNTTWQLRPCGELTAYLAPPCDPLDLVGCRAALGSRLHLNFALQGEALRGFLRKETAGVAAAVAARR